MKRALHQEIRISVLHPQHIQEHVVADVVGAVQSVSLTIQHSCSAAGAGKCFMPCNSQHGHHMNSVTAVHSRVYVLEPTVQLSEVKHTWYHVNYFVKNIERCTSDDFRVCTNKCNALASVQLAWKGVFGAFSLWMVDEPIKRCHGKYLLVRGVDTKTIGAYSRTFRHLGVHLLVQHLNNDSSVVFPSPSCSPAHLNVLARGYPSLPSRNK